MPSDPERLLLDMRGVSKAFAGNPVVKNVDFQCRAGEIHGLIGENGAGKSTLMKILAGIHAPDAGSLRVDGREVSFAGYDEASRAGICVVYQELSLLPALSVAENIFLGAWRRGGAGLVDWRKMREEASRVLAAVGLAGLDVNLLVGSLPMAARQLIEVAKAILRDPHIIVFDEPTTTLTERESERLFALMRDLRGGGKAVVFISHRLREVVNNCDRVTVMKDGERMFTGDIAGLDENRLIFHMIGRDLSDIYPPKLAAPSDREIFSYRGPPARGGRPVAFGVREGEVLGVGGLGGQGQIPMLESIFGLGSGEAATVTVGGREHRVGNPRQAMRLGISLIPEDRNRQASFPILSILENAAAASLRRRSRFGLVQIGRERSEVAEMAERLKVRMTSLAQELMYLSGGNIQKTVFARWLLADPGVMVLLSPTSGIDVGAKRQIYHLIRELAGRGVAIIVMTGDMMELIGLCDRVLVMYDGEISGELSGDRLTEENIMKASVARAPEGARA